MQMSLKYHFKQLRYIYIYVYEFMMHPLQEMQFGIVRVQRSAFAESDP